MAAHAPRDPRNPPVLKKYGQHFLTDRAILESIADALAPTAQDTVLEVGPGRGGLTDILVERAGKVVAVEIDRALAKLLEKKYEGNASVRIVQEDVLETDVRALVGSDYLLAGNVPYYITTPIIFKSLEPPVPRRSVFLVQMEVAQRLASPPGSSEYGALTVNVAARSQVEIVRRVSAKSFSPPPKVESALIRLTPREKPLIALDRISAFRGFVQAAFGQRRKQIQRVIRSVSALPADRSAEILERAGIDPKARPETLSPELFVVLFDAVTAEAKS